MANGKKGKKAINTAKRQVNKNGLGMFFGGEGGEAQRVVLAVSFVSELAEVKEDNYLIRPAERQGYS